MQHYSLGNLLKICDAVWRVSAGAAIQQQTHFGRDLDTGVLELLHELGVSATARRWRLGARCWQEGLAVDAGPTFCPASRTSLSMPSLSIVMADGGWERSMPGSSAGVGVGVVVSPGTERGASRTVSHAESPPPASGQLARCACSQLTLLLHQIPQARHSRTRALVVVDLARKVLDTRVHHGVGGGVLGCADDSRGRECAHDRHAGAGASACARGQRREAEDAGRGGREGHCLCDAVWAVEPAKLVSVGWRLPVDSGRRVPS